MNVPPIHRYPPTSPHGVTTKKTVADVFIAMRNSDLHEQCYLGLKKEVAVYVYKSLSVLSHLALLFVQKTI